jgi:hypothetical protein
MDGIEQKSRADLVKVGVIQYIGGLSTELNIDSLIYIRVFEQGSIPSPGAWTKYRTAWGVPGPNTVRGWIGK